MFGALLAFGGVTRSVSAAPPATSRAEPRARTEAAEAQATAADDDVDGAEDRRLRVHIDTQAAGGAWVHRDVAPPDMSRDSLSFGLGVGRPSMLDDGAALFSRPIIGFGLGYLFDNQRTLFGAKLALTLDGYGLSDDAPTFAVGGRFVPYLQWMFRPGHALRPWVEGRVGLGGLSTMRGQTNTQVLYPIVGAGTGVHVFAREWFSVDAGFDLDYAAPLLRSSERDAAQGASQWRKRADVIGFGLVLGLSTWF